jgi:hypothetical protein
MTTTIETSPNGVDHAIVNGRCVTCRGDHTEWATGEQCRTCGDTDHSTAQHSSPLDAIPDNLRD